MAGKIYDVRQLPIALDVPLTAQLIGAKEKHVRQLLRDGTLIGFKLGQEWRVLKSEALRFMGAQEDENAPGGCISIPFTKRGDLASGQKSSAR